MMPSLPYRLEVDGLAIRCYDPTDAPEVLDAVAASRPHLAAWLPWAAEEATLDEQVDLLRSFRAQFDTDGDGIYGIFSGRQFVGGIGMHERVGPNARELGYWVHVDHTRRGIVTRAAAALTRIGFEFLDLARMEIHCDPDNVASAGVPRKLGYELEATLRLRPVNPDHPILRDRQIWTMFSDRYPESPYAAIDVVAYDAIGRQVFPT